MVSIYDVGHGFCGYVRDEVTGQNNLFDCGYNEHTGFHPVDEILATYGRIGELVIQNCDEDHMDGLPHLIEKAGAAPVSTVRANRSVTSWDLLTLKEPPYGDGLLAMLGLNATYNQPVPVAAPSAFGSPQPSVTTSFYCNRYPTFTDTNNLSVVTFIQGPTYKLVMSGDLEVAGWKELLKNPAFRAELAMVRVFVASHHGRQNGYCEEVFDYCQPDVVIISDEPMQYDSQEHCYEKHAKGIKWNGGPQVRKVLTTRNDGHLRITDTALSYHILASAA